MLALIFLSTSGCTSAVFNRIQFLAILYEVSAASKLLP